MQYCIMRITEYAPDGISPKSVEVFDMDRDAFIGVDELDNVNVDSLHWPIDLARVILAVLSTKTEHRLDNLALSVPFIFHRNTIH